MKNDDYIIDLLSRVIDQSINIQAHDSKMGTGRRQDQMAAGMPTVQLTIKREIWRQVIADEGLPDNHGTMWYILGRDPVQPRDPLSRPAECHPEARAQGILGNLNEYGSHEIPLGVRLRIGWSNANERDDIRDVVRKHWRETEQLHKLGKAATHEYWGIYGVILDKEVAFDHLKISPIDEPQGTWLRNENNSKHGVGQGPAYVPESVAVENGTKKKMARGLDQGVVVDAPVEVLTTKPDRSQGISVSQGYRETREIRHLRYAMTLAGGEEVLQGFSVAGGEWWGVPLVSSLTGTNIYRPIGKGVIDLRGKEESIVEWYRRVAEVEKHEDRLHRAMLVAEETIRDTGVAGFVRATNLLRIVECLAADEDRKKNRHQQTQVINDACLKAAREKGGADRIGEAVTGRLSKIRTLRRAEAHYKGGKYEPWLVHEEMLWLWRLIIRMMKICVEKNDMKFFEAKHG